MSQPWYQRGYRRMLVDMHIPDWDPAMLSKYDPREMVRLYKKAGLTSVMFYCQSHVGLCYWPTRTGRMHAGLKGRDIVGETLGLLRKARIAACGYYSVIYNNWAYLEHPEWRLIPATGGALLSNGGRYGRCCPNNPGYRDFALDQATELIGSYRFDGMFFDMTFWPRVCVCDWCRARFRTECGAEIPQTIDWCSPEWSAFQEARQRWLAEFAAALTDRAKKTNPGLVVYHNFATAHSNWVPGVSFRTAEANDFLGADFYGDPVEQLMVVKLMNRLTRNRPAEFMTSRCVNLVEHEKNKSADVIHMQAMASAISSAAMLFIDAIAPDGTVNPEPYKMIRQVFDEMSRHEPLMGGRPVEDVAVYFSDDSKMDFAENGKPLAEAGVWKRDYPHLRAARGACRTLQENHIPFGVITRKDLGRLDSFKTVILPNVLRMDEEEVEAFRAYVRSGGRLYASRYTSLTETRGLRRDDFLLADVFGCRFASDDLGRVTYLKPRDPAVVRAVRPQRYISNMATKGSPNESGGTLRLADRAKGKVLATLSLPFGQEWGTVHDRTWSSIHSSPPWQDTRTPAIVEHRFGKGRAVYAAADVESLDGDADRRLFLALVRGLVGPRQSASAEAHPSVWMSVTDQPDRKRIVIGFLNYQERLPAIPIAGIPFTVRPPKGRRFTRLRLEPGGKTLRFTRDKSGALRATLPTLEVIAMLSAEYR